MPRILDYTGQDRDRTVTVASIRQLKGTGTQYAQVTASTAGEAAAADDAPAQATPGGRRITYRSGTGITLTLYLNRDEITIPEIQQTLREAIEELEAPPPSS